MTTRVEAFRRIPSHESRIGRSAHCYKVRFHRESTVVTAAVDNSMGRPTMVDEFVARVIAIAGGLGPSRSGGSERLDACEARAHAFAAAGGGSAEVRRAAAVEFLGDGVTTLALDGAWEDGAARRVVVDAAAALDMAPGAALLAVFVHALRSSDTAQLPPQAATQLFLWLFVELGPADAASVWALGPSGRVEWLGGFGGAPRSRRSRTAATAVLSGRASGSPNVHAVTVERWDKTFAALVARAPACQAARVGVWMRETASALTPVVERETLFRRNAERERELASAAERRLLRLGYDLHDGPLQGVVALAEDLRLLRGQMLSILETPQRSLVGGRFDDLEARLGSLDGDLRELARTVRPTAAVECPLEDVLRREVERFRHASGIEATLEATGDLSDLTDSQKIVLYRVVQESLANVRKHSAATRADVVVRAAAAYVEVTVADDGCGFDVHSTVQRALRSDRLGLAGLHERVLLLGGTLELAARVGEGVVVCATLPRWRPLEPRRDTPYTSTAA